MYAICLLKILPHIFHNGLYQVSKKHLFVILICRGGELF
jgi:hypothetical protein